MLPGNRNVTICKDKTAVNPFRSKIVKTVSGTLLIKG